MKRIILMVFLTTFLFSGCGLYKKTTEREKTTKTTEKTKESTKDSTTSVIQTAPTESEIVLDIESLSKMIGDFEQRIASGDGNESIIEKKDGKLRIRNTNSGSKETDTKVKNTDTQTTYNSEFVWKETKKVIARLPWWFWLVVGLTVLIMFRKVIAQIMIALIPGLGTWRLLRLFIGDNPSK